MNDFQISTTDLELFYTEARGTKVEVDAIPFRNLQEKTRKYVDMEIYFRVVAEVKCISANFFEFHYKNHDFHLIEEFSNKMCGFYEIIDSEHLQNNKKQYDPNDLWDLRYYLIVGYDSFVELIASSDYTITTKAKGV